MGDDKTPQQIAAGLTPAQRRALLCDKTPYGPMSTPGLGGNSWGWSGGNGPPLAAATARKLHDLKLWVWVRDKYPLGYYERSNLGLAVRAIVAQEAARDA